MSIRILTQYLVSIFVVFATVAAACGQSDEIKIETELAGFEVSVSDKNGNPVRGLTAEDFKVFENGRERKIDFFQPIRKRDDKRPLAIVFALDVSGSMTDAELGRLRIATDNFIKRLADYESVFAVVAFAMQVKTTQSFTNRPDKVQQAFDKLRKDQDGLSTHAYDAVDHAVRLIQKRSPKAIRTAFPRRAVILITDGFPVGDVVSPSTVIERANENQTSVYSVLLPSFSRLQRGGRRIFTPLEASGLSEKTGGMSITATDNDFEKIFSALAEEITSSYAIAFYPDENSGTGEKTVRIESRPDLVVRQNRTTYRPGN
jgi:VWFA-related protein